MIRRIRRIKSFIQENIRYYHWDVDGNSFLCFKDENGEWVHVGNLENSSLKDFDENDEIKNALDNFVRKEKLEKLLEK